MSWLNLSLKSNETNSPVIVILLFNHFLLENFCEEVEQESCVHTEVGQCEKITEEVCQNVGDRVCEGIGQIEISTNNKINSLKSL